MSHIRFDNGTKQAFLRGAERHWMAQVVNNLATSTLNIMEFSTPSWTRQMLPPNHYALNESRQRYEDAFLTWLRVDGRGLRHPVTGIPLDAFSVVLNTAWQIGSSAVRLMARLHGQCEVHAYVPPGDGHSVAGLIIEGRRIGLYRPDMGWEEVADFLRCSSDEGKAVVTSYSVTETFPGWNPETEEANDWGDAFAALNRFNAITMNGWADFHFGNGETFMSLEAEWSASQSTGSDRKPRKSTL